MALQVLRNIAARIQKAPFFAILVDETTDVSNEEQAVVIIRWVDDQLQVHQDFIGLYKLDTIEANSIVFMMKDVLQRLNLAMAKVQGQCYDGASAMSGAKNGVATQICKMEPRAITPTVMDTPST